MEYGQMIAGCAAALKSKDGKIGFLGPLINDETRRLTNAAYLGAKHCYEGEAELEFEVVWIGFWFHIPGLTIDPTKVTNGFFESQTLTLSQSLGMGMLDSLGKLIG